MKRILNLIGMSIGGWLGWMAASPFGLFAGYVASVVGLGAGLYAIRRVTKGLP